MYLINETLNKMTAASSGVKRRYRCLYNFSTFILPLLEKIKYLIFNQYGNAQKFKQMKKYDNVTDFVVVLSLSVLQVTR